MVRGAVKALRRARARVHLAPPARALAAAVVAVAAIATAASPAQAGFGIAHFTTESSTSQAGAHPNLAAAFALNTEALGNPTGQVRRAALTLPSGLLGNPEASEKCGQADFQELRCPTDTQVGVLDATFVVCQGIATALQAQAKTGEEVVTVTSTNGLCASEGADTVTIGTETVQIAYVLSETTIQLKSPLASEHKPGEPLVQLAQTASAPIPLYDLQPTPGHAATLGASVLVASILAQIDLTPGGRLIAELEEISTLLPLREAVLTLWGVPAEAEHDTQRCDQLESSCGTPSGAASRPFTENPTDCSSRPLETEIGLESWEGQPASDTATMPPITGCQELQLAGALRVTPASTERDTPSGYSIDLTLPQNEEPDGLATPAIGGVEVTLPEGTSLSPSLAEGLQPCSDAQFLARACTSASLVGTVTIQTPLLSEPLTGGLYIGAPTATEKYRVLSYVKAAGATIGLAGQIAANPATGRLTAIFRETPELPIGELRLSLFGGPSAPLANPASCGPAESVARLTAYSGQSLETDSTFTVDGDGDGAPCPARTPFAPAFTAGAATPLAAAFTPFALGISRNDGEQTLAGFDVTLPAGLDGILKSAVPCPEPEAAQGACPAASRLGTATIAAGAGPQPLQRTGSVYLTGPYRGAPFGLAVVVDASTAAIQLGTITLRATVTLNPNTLALTIASDPLPQILEGVPLRLRSVNVSLDRPSFLVDPSSCARQQIAATIDGLEGALATPSAPFALTGCAGLRFAPTLSASTQARAGERSGGAALRLRIAQPAGSIAQPAGAGATGSPSDSSHSGLASAAIRSAIVELPGILRPRLSAIQGACFSAGGPLQPSACPASSRIGSAAVATPMLDSPLTGALYLLARGGRTKPSLVVLLSGDGVSAELVGSFTVGPADSISAVFRALPDIPIDALTIELPRGPGSLLGAIASPCAKPLKLPYILTAQNGLQVKAAASIAVSGCPRRARRLNGRDRHRHGDSQHHHASRRPPS